MFRADATTLDELRRSLAALAAAREEAEERRRRRAAEAEGEAPIRRYEGAAARDLDVLGGDARREVYSHPGVSVFAAPSRNEPPRIVFGALGGEPVWQRDRTSKLSPDANSSPNKSFGSALILREGEPPNVTFRIPGAA